MRAFRLIGHFARASAQQELAYRTDFLIKLLHSWLNLVTGVIGVFVIFNQVDTVRGWDLPATLALLGVYLLLNALRDLFIGPSLEALAGMDGAIWHGRFDFTLLRPVNTQFLVSCQQWRLLSLLDLLLGGGVLATAVYLLQPTLTGWRLLSFLLMLGVSTAILYAILLTFTALVFWSPGMLFTWIFNSILQMARYPVELYPGSLRLLLTWVVPVGLMTTMPVQVLRGQITAVTLLATTLFAGLLLAGASLLFWRGLHHYESASS